MSRRDIPPEDLERGLLALAISGGNGDEAARHLALLEPPIKVAPSTLQRWKIKHAKRYSEIQAERAPIIEAIVLEQIREAILQAGKLQSRVLEKLLLAVEDGSLEPKDLAGILKSAGVSLGINVEKMLLMTNRPTVIAEKRDVAEIVQALSARVPGLFDAPGEATEITDGKALGSG